uniref:Cytosol aminopeptidase domain-containing protein n=1 Tax=Plectus sambesii TaxID=2011161 RepID=A0A914WL52_9BILA
MRLGLLLLVTRSSRQFSKATMATVTVRAGLTDQVIPTSQLMIVGKQAHLKKLPFAQFSSKFGGLVSSQMYESAQGVVAGGASTVSLYLNCAQIISVGDQTSRHNAPSNCHSISKHVKAVSLVTPKVSLVAVVDYPDVLAVVGALARCFPLYNRKTKQSHNGEHISIELLLVDGKTLSPKEVSVLQSLVDSIRLAGRLVDAPCNELHSIALMNEALAVADSLDVPIERLVIKGEELREKGFGGIYNVGKAALHPPVFVCLSYKPNGAKETFALVGKGIVYDTGGMQIKTKTMMPSMKRDMGGAAGVLGGFATLVKAGFKQNLHCLLCIAENMIAPNANKPDDVITMLSGKTVEINNTDAEGRLVLADGVYYAQTVLKASVIIDMATLTGAQSYATGQKHAALMTNKERWETSACLAGRYSGDLVHPIPYCPDLYFPDLASTLADMKNSNLGKMTGPPSCIAGLFIGAHINFTDDVDWLHFDMAAPSEVAERATGYG